MWNWKPKKQNKKPKDYSTMALEEKRTYYRCGDFYVTLDQVESWPDYAKDSHYYFTKKGWLQKDSKFTYDNDHINKKVSLWLGDITQLEIDAIVNAANKTLLGSEVDDCIYRAAGRELLDECRKLNGCLTGHAKITTGQKLPAKYVIHTVGPVGEKAPQLESCYNSCLELVKVHELSSVAFCCISTGKNGYPNKKAAHVALKTVKTWLEENDDWDGRIIFCVFLQEDLTIYQKLMLQYFPCTIEENVKKSEEDKPVDFEPKAIGPTVKPNDEKPGTTETKTAPPRSKGRGRGGKRANAVMPPKSPTLLQLFKSFYPNKNNIPKGDSHSEGSKGKVDDSGSPSRKRKDVEEEIMRTAGIDTTKLAEGVAENEEKGKDDSASSFRENETTSGGDVENMDTLEDGKVNKTTKSDEAAVPVDTSEGDKVNTTTQGDEAAAVMDTSGGDEVNKTIESDGSAITMDISGGDKADRMMESDASAGTTADEGDLEEEEYRRAYSEALEKGKAKINRIPIMLVGQARGGKTSLMRRLLGLPFNKDQPSTIGIDVDIIELTEENAYDPWVKREVEEFMTNEDEAKTVIYQTTADYVDRGVQRNSEEGAPVPLKPTKPVPIKPMTPVKPLSVEEIVKIKTQSSTQHNQKEVIRVFLNDFAGQKIYYDTHGCFVKPHCPYVLVYDLSLEFDEPAVPRFKASEKEEEEGMSNSYRTTNLDHFTSWLKFLQSLEEYQDERFSDKSGHCSTAAGENFKLPPVLIALTHCDNCGIINNKSNSIIDKIKKMLFPRRYENVDPQVLMKNSNSKIDCVRSRIMKVLSAGKYENVVPEFFLINNTLMGDEGDDVRKLRAKLFDLSKAVLEQEISIPIKWLDFEVALSKKLSPNCNYIPVDEAKKEAEACGVEFDQAIKSLHRLGAVVYYSGSSKVVLDPHWLMNRFTKVISMPGKLDALSRHALDVFKEKGILFQEYLETLEDAELLEELMQKFNLISFCQYEEKPAFYLPSVAPSMKQGDELEASTIPSLFVTFPRQLVPMSLFTKFQVKLISEWKKSFPNQQVTPSFYCNYSTLPFIIDGDVYDVRLVEFHEFVKVTVFPKQDGNHFNFARHLLTTLKKCLDDLKSPDQLLFSMTSYDLEVKCTCCFGKEESECSRHHKIQCDSDRCGHRHFWKLSELQRFYDDRSPAICQSDKRSSKVFDIKSVKIWLNIVPDAPIVVENSLQCGLSDGNSGKVLASVSDAVMVEDSSQCGLLHETSGETSGSASGAQTTDDSRRRSMRANYVKRMGKCADSVGMIALKNEDDDELTYTGTGWLVAKDEGESYVMTNHHVICAINQRSSQTQRDIKVVIQFDYQTNAQPSCVEFEVAHEAEIFDENLDYAVLKVQSNCPGSDCLAVSTRLLNLDSNVNVIGHPKANPKSVMRGKVLHIPRTKQSSSEELHKWVEENTKQYCPRESCKGETKEVVCVHNYEKWRKLERRKDFLLIHKCGTSQGASGSPVLNDNGEVIALHSWGMFLGNEQEREKPALEFAHSINFIVNNIKERDEALARKLKFSELKTK